MNYEIYSPELYGKSGDDRSRCIQALLALYGQPLVWHDGDCVLEIGCGIGDVTENCFLPLLPRRNFKRYVCSDASLKMLNATRTRFSKLEHVDFELLDIGIPVDSVLCASFNRIFSTICLMYIPNQKQMFKNIYDLLLPDGDCWLQMFTTGAIFESLFQTAEMPKWQEKLHNIRDIFVFPYREDPHPERTVEELMKLVGFVDISVKIHDSYQKYETADRFREVLKCFPDFAPKLTLEEKKDLLEDQVKFGVTMNMIEEFYDPNKPRYQPVFQSLVIYGRKP
ncbi:Methyltransferase domain 25 [Sergentomyia squamirostris]